ARLTDAEMAPVVRELAAIRWTTFTDNFLIVKAGEQFLDNGDPGHMDWFDDRHWDSICHNIGVLTRVAQAARCVGLGFDPEPYHSSVWNYDRAGSRKPQLHRDTKSFAEYASVVRRRGAQYMSAIQTEMPRVRLFNLYQAVRLPPSDLAETIYSLYPAFINGMLDAAGPGVVLIDGNEYGFSLLTRGDYTNAYVNVKERKLALIDPKNRDTYRRQVQVSVPIYLDDIFGTHANRRWVGTYLTPGDKHRLFEHKLFHALDSVDEYVWVYGERPAWFGTPRVPRWAASSARKIRKRVGQLRLEAREEDTAFISRVRNRIAFRDRELAALDPAERTTPRVTPPTATIRRLQPDVPPPGIDGKLDDPAWKLATILGDFQPLMYFVRDRRAVETVCRVTWDDRFLYLAFECHEPRIEELASLSESERRGNRTTLVLSQTVPNTVQDADTRKIPADEKSFTRIDVPLEGDSGRLTRKAGQGWNPEHVDERQLIRAQHTTDKGWTAEWCVSWALLGGVPRPRESRRATVTRVRSPWAEHDSWAPQIDPNLIDDKLLGTWVFQP
ncbi:MAG: hypothetical protein VB858_07610, partial [Planctomycetaceae bacterium]